MSVAVITEQVLPIDAVNDETYARVYGEILTKIPEDLYIPPDALAVFLEAFEGL
jgi:segregation and condensation protein A